MPLYEYRCPNGHDFEQFFRSIGTASSEAECPVCHAIGERRLSTTGLVFKGSGFYITDYGKDGKKAEREAATAAKTKSDAAASLSPSDAAATKKDAKSDAASTVAPKATDSAAPKESTPKADPAKSPSKTTTSE